MYRIAQAALVALSCLVVGSSAYPQLASRQSGGVVIKAAPKATDTGLKGIPDADHPFIAPGPNDQRGPCPGLNTLANHGYLPRNGIATFEQIVTAVQEGLNMEYTLASALSAFGVLARGNAFTNQVSIGGASSSVPPLPGNIDGNTARGLASHGRFEGDVSMTRADAAIGDNVNFSQTLFNQLLAQVAQYGSDSPVTGAKSIVTLKAMQEFKYQRVLDSQKNDPVLQFHAGRYQLSYGENAFTLQFFANGTDGTLSVPTMTSFFRDQHFPDNWHRRSSPGDLSLITNVGSQIASAHLVLPGENKDGKYVSDPISSISTCSLYTNLAADNLPAVLLNTTGTLKQNVDFLLNTIHDLFPSCTKTLPRGPANV